MMVFLYNSSHQVEFRTIRKVMGKGVEGNCPAV